MKLVENPSITTASYEILNNNILLFQNFISKNICDEAIAEAQNADLVNRYANYEDGVSFVSYFDGGSPIHYFRFYSGPDEKYKNLYYVYTQLKNVSKTIRSNLNQNSNNDPEYADYHLELLHYSPGIFFKRHQHEKEPQRIGLICLLTKEFSGQISTIFYEDDQIIDTGKFVKQGDLIVFPWDIEHEVPPILESDRWVALLTYY